MKIFTPIPSRLPEPQRGRPGKDWSAVHAALIGTAQYSLGEGTSADRKEMEAEAASLRRYLAKAEPGSYWVVAVVAAGDDELALIARRLDGAAAEARRLQGERLRATRRTKAA